jgi:hypothetical protein
MKWTDYASDPDHFENIPKPREYSAMGFNFEERESKLIIFGGWNNGWYNDLYSLNVSKIVGPSYAITESEPNLGQLSGKTMITITGQGFQTAGAKVFFTVGNKPVDSQTKNTFDAAANYENDNVITCETPDLSKQFQNEVDAVVQV